MTNTERNKVKWASFYAFLLFIIAISVLALAINKRSGEHKKTTHGPVYYKAVCPSYSDEVVKVDSQFYTLGGHHVWLPLKSCVLIAKEKTSGIVKER